MYVEMPTKRPVRLETKGHSAPATRAMQSRLATGHFPTGLAGSGTEWALRRLPWRYRACAMQRPFRRRRHLLRCHLIRSACRAPGRGRAARQRLNWRPLGAASLLQRSCRSRGAVEHTSLYRSVATQLSHHRCGVALTVTELAPAPDAPLAVTL
ncbi:hypothetical protein XAP6164_2100013 [Xanthomonas phaseoli pv. phaseoli]|nr:hypothetical protein XAP6164_2100013 [Xanthomonas phaseoli pv. phaseoli]